MSLIWKEDLAKGKKWKPNPKPKIPQTGWTLRREFPDLSGAKAICFDVETKDPHIEESGPGWGRGDGYIIGVALATSDGFKNYYPIRHDGYDNHEPQKVLDYCREQLGRQEQAKVGHNTLYDLGWLEHEGVPVVGDIYDTWTAEKLLDHAAGASLQECGQKYLKEGKESDALYDWAWSYWGQGKAKSDKARRKVSMANLWRTPPELVGFYAESDVDLPLRIGPIQFELLHELGLWEVFRMECDLQPLLVQMRLAGVSVDLDAAERAYAEIEASASVIQKQIDGIAGRPISTGSPVDMEKLFSKMKIPFNRTANGKMSLTGAFLQTVEHPVGKMVVELEELKRYNSAFIKNAILESNVNGKVHGEFNPLRAVTGRMSASNPNLQQVPSRNELAKMVRGIFVPDTGHDHWRKYDYSSIESRLLAHFAVGQGAKALRKEYKDNPDTDYHNFTQAMIKQLVGQELNRKHVKAVNFAGIYGASEKKLQSMMGLTDEDAESFFAAYHDGLPYVKKTMEFMSQYAEEHGETRTIIGRRASFDFWEPKYTPRGAPRPMALKFEKAIEAYGPNIKRAHLHKGLNYVLQGSAADLMKKSMVQCWKDGVFADVGVPRLVVHDELDFSVQAGWNEDAFKEMQHIMETSIPFKVPIRVAGEWGPSWAKLYDL